MERRPRYLHVRMEGEESQEEALRFWQELAVGAAAEGIDDVLIVDTVEGQLGTVSHYEISKVVAQLFAGKRIAYVDPKGATWQANDFGATVIRNRGGLARVFRTEAEAEAWLYAG